MQYILEFLEWIFQLTFSGLQVIGHNLNVVIIIFIAFGLAYWTFFWQKKYNKIAEKDPNQLQ